MSTSGKRRRSGTHGRAFDSVVGVFILLLLLPLGIIAAPFLIIYYGIIEPCRRWCFRRRYAGRMVLVWTSRRGWHDFMVNNVLPMLPKGTITVCQRKTRPPVLSEAGFPVRHLRLGSLSRPYLVAIDSHRYSTILLNSKLGQLKDCAARQPEVQRLVARILEDAVHTATEGPRKHFGGIPAGS
jgi:hypothetical protein